jgi:hypothetical protein
MDDVFKLRQYLQRMGFPKLRLGEEAADVISI